MTTKAETIGPDGKPFAMTHRHALTLKEYRIVHGPIMHAVSAAEIYVLADKSGSLSWVNAASLNPSGLLEYVPGGQ